MFAVIKSGGRQYKISVGQTLEVNRLPVDDGAQVKFEEVLLISDENGSMIGTPLLDNAMVLATAIKQGRGEKLIVFRYKSKKRFRHRRGHRQELTILSIDDIVADGKSLITGNAPETKETPAEEEEEEVATPATTETAEPETPESETTETPTEQKPARRRRTAKVENVEDTESKAEEE
jgi:large subunit ribosomal protein L21